eukprot:TRINITY_DN1951_c0_g1_i2.p1 TRINITY_DN1951_c0_g1~~TRINITY_DN1951_c0_g1_i2.p1  ORF type:complete len:184 (-),score=28.81 TRINITY_DN1951_c0_g1_i2:55-606(-)
MVFKYNCNVYIVEYRGYGKSTGQPSEHGLKIDSETALNYLLNRQDISRSKIIIFGRSLGGAVAISLASKNQDKIKALIVENTFISIGGMADVMFPVLGYFKFLINNKWDSINTIKNITQIPVLFISGEQDEMVPMWMMQALYNQCGSVKKRLHSYPNGKHMDTWIDPSYTDRLGDWIQRTIDE